MTTNITAEQIQMRADEIANDVLGNQYTDDDLIEAMNVGVNMDPLEYAAFGYLLARYVFD